MTVGERIKNKRLELGYSQDELAKKAGYKSRSSINKIELSRDLPLNKIEIVARALECSPSYLMGWTEIEENANMDVELTNMEKRIKEYALKLAKLEIDKQEHVMNLIDMLEK